MPISHGKRINLEIGLQYDTNASRTIYYRTRAKEPKSKKTAYTVKEKVQTNAATYKAKIPSKAK